MSRRSDELLLEDIRESVGRILAATNGMDLVDFEGNVNIQDAVIRNFEVIGEATKSLSPELKANYPAIDWSGMVGFRNFLIHVYFGVDLGVVWQIIQHELPLLSQQLGSIAI